MPASDHTVPEPPGVDIERHTLDLRLVQLATVAASLFFVLLIGIWIVDGATRFLIQSIAPAAVASSGWVMLAMRRPVVSLHLAIGAIGMTIYVAAGEPSVPGDPLLGLFVMTIVGAALVRRRIIVYSLIACAGLIIAGFAWHPPDVPVSGRLIEGFTATTAYGIIVWLLFWQRAQSARDRNALRQLVDTKDEFVAAISHELRTPLTAVVGVAHELNGYLTSFSQEEITELTELLVTESADMTDIVEDLLVVARADLGNLVIDRRPIDITESIESVVADMTGAPIAMELERPLVVSSDRLRTRQILRNLIGNAVRHGGASVRVVARRDDSTATIEVRDDGPPLPDADREKIFEAYRSAATVAGKPGSTGLGLTVSRRLARTFGGDVTYHHDGNETVFTLSMPLVDTTTGSPRT